MSTTSQPAAVELSVVVVNWNGAGYVDPCLDSARGPARELIVIDNASTDDSVARLRARRDVHLLENDRNLGFARAANQGLRAAQGRYVLFLNPDARANDEAVAAAIATLAERPEVGLVGVAQRDAHGALTPTVEPFFSLAALRRRWHRRVTAPAGNGPVAIDWCHGAFLLGRRHELVALGGFDEAFFLYAEDMDLCFRVHASRKSVVYLPQVSIVHEGNRAGEEMFAERRAAAIFASQLLFYRRRHGRPATLLLRGLAWLAFAARAVGYRLMGSPLAERYAALASVALRGALEPSTPAPGARPLPAAAAGKP